MGKPAEEEATEKVDLTEHYEALRGLTVQEALRYGQELLLTELIVRVRAGIASHQEMAILKGMLKDNGMVLGIPPDAPKALGTPDVPMSLPDFGKPEYEQDE